jgi:hypothetical protein
MNRNVPHYFCTGMRNSLHLFLLSTHFLQNVLDMYLLSEILQSGLI